MSASLTHYTVSELEKLDRRYRANLLNKISGLKPANLIGTTDGKSTHNLALFNSVLHLGANPALLGILFRPLTVERHTYENIQATGWFTINQVHQGIYQQAHQCSAKYERGVSEFEATNLTPLFNADVPAPYVAESHIRIGLELEEEQHIRANDTRLVIGRVKHLFLPREQVSATGDLNLAELQTVAIGGLDSYYSAERLAVLPYAKP